MKETQCTDLGEERKKEREREREEKRREEKRRTFKVASSICDSPVQERAQGTERCLL